MALFSVSVLSTLNIPRQERETLQRVAVALEAIVTKINEPDTEPPLPEDETALQAQIDALTQRLKEANDKLEAKTAQGNSA